MQRPNNILIIEPNERKRNWLLHTLLMSPSFKSVTALTTIKDIDSQGIELTDLILVVSEVQFKALLKYISIRFSSHEIPFPILVLTKNFESTNLSKFTDLTIDAFPTDEVTPQFVEHFLKTLARDYIKDNRLKKLAHFDSLTKATNRRLFEDRLKQALLRAKRAKEPISLLYFDLDKFKLINDQYGHSTGDEFLKAFVSVVKNEIRDSDTIGRFGGDEFGVLLPKTNGVYAKEITHRILTQLNAPRSIGGIALSISSSVGLVSYSGTEGTEQFSVKSITQKADSAVYKAKSLGRNQCVVYSPNIEIPGGTHNE